MPRASSPSRLWHLAQGHEHAGAGHEAEDDRLGDVARQVAQAQQGDEHLNRADQDRQQEDDLDGRGLLAVRRSSPATAPKTTSEMALVGPLIRWTDEPNSEPRAVMTMAVYSPYCGSTPAMRA